MNNIHWRRTFRRPNSSRGPIAVLTLAMLAGVGALVMGSASATSNPPARSVSITNAVASCDGNVTFNVNYSAPEPAADVTPTVDGTPEDVANGQSVPGSVAVSSSGHAVGSTVILGASVTFYDPSGGVDPFDANAQDMSVVVPPCPVDPIHVTPQTPTSVDACGTANDSLSIPTQVGVVYATSGSVASGSVTVTASAADGYVLDGTTSWTFTFTNVACPVDPIHVTPQTPTSVDACGTANDSLSIPTQVGVVYATSGSVASGSVTVTASAADGYVLDGTTSWTFTFTNVACPVDPIHVTPQTPTSVDACGTANDSLSIPTQVGVVYVTSGSVASGSVTVTASAADGYVLDGTTSWTFTFTNVACVGSGPTPPPSNDDAIPVTV